MAEGSTTIKDLDVLIPQDKQVTLKGSVYRLPGDLPMETYLKVNAAAGAQEDGEAEADLMLRMVDALADLFVWNAPDAEKESRRAKVLADLRSLGVRTVTSLLSEIYGDDPEPEADSDTVDPPAPSEDGTPSTT